MMTGWLVALGISMEVAVTAAAFVMAARLAPEMHTFWLLYVFGLLAGYLVIIGLLLFAAYWWTRDQLDKE
jgi:hypothetical protein